MKKVQDVILTPDPKLKRYHTESEQVSRQVSSNTFSAKKQQKNRSLCYPCGKNLDSCTQRTTPYFSPLPQAIHHRKLVSTQWAANESDPFLNLRQVAPSLFLPPSLAIRLGSLTAFLFIWPPLFRDPDTKWPSVRPHTYTHDREDMGNEGERVINSTKEKLNSS